MTVETKQRTNRWLPITLIVWNLFDIAVHIAVDMVEVLRVSGNVLGIVVAVLVITGVTKAKAHDVLVGSAFAVVVLNSIFVAVNAFFAAPASVIAPMLVFVGVSVLLLVRWAQVERLEKERARTDGNDVELRFYHRWWMALVVSLVGVLVVALIGLVAS